jgi:hypothetical protein
MHGQIKGPRFVVNCAMGSTLPALGTIFLPVLVHSGSGANPETYQILSGSAGPYGSAGREGQTCGAQSAIPVAFVVVEGKVRAPGNVRKEDASGRCRIGPTSHHGRASMILVAWRIRGCSDGLLCLPGERVHAGYRDLYSLGSQPAQPGTSLASGACCGLVGWLLRVDRLICLMVWKMALSQPSCLVIATPGR